jgi:hypothetical protein
MAGGFIFSPDLLMAVFFPARVPLLRPCLVLADVLAGGPLGFSPEGAGERSREG